jgi:hypothetical protein
MRSMRRAAAAGVIRLRGQMVDAVAISGRAVAIAALMLIAYASPTPASPPLPSGAPAPAPAPRVGYTPPPPSTGVPAPPSSASRPLPPPSTQAMRSGRYRLTLLGAAAYRQTKAGGIVGAVGASDTFFFVTDILLLSAKGADAVSRRQSWTYGRLVTNGPVVHADWIRAGSAGSEGGIKSGDTIPYAQPWIRKQPIGPVRLPQLIWEGTLIDGINSVLVGPTVWKYEDGRWREGRFRGFAASPAGMASLMLADLQPSPELFNAINDIARTRGAVVPLPALLNPQAIPRFSTGAGSSPTNSSGVVGLAGNAVAAASADRPIGVTYQNGVQIFVPKVLVLNYATAESSLAPSQMPNVPNLFGASVQMPRGTVLVRYQDDQGLGGDYEMFFQIERIQ